MRPPTLVAVALAALSLVSLASAAKLVVEDWTAQPPGVPGIPPGWRAYETPGGRPDYDVVVTEDVGRRALRVSSHDEHSTFA
jgi:hypothetical protein